MKPKRHPKYVNYLIYPDGRVWSIPRKYKPNGNFMVHKTQCNDKYLFVNLFIDGKVTNKRVHRLVAETFVPNIYNKEIVNHIDGNKFNNNYTNLEWCSYSENSLHAWRIGLRKYTGYSQGCKNGISKLSEEDVRWIKFFKGKSKQLEISQIFEVSPAAIWCIWTGKTWNHVESY